MSAQKKRVVVIGGGAAGFFAAINCAQQNEECSVEIYEQSQRVLQKVKISGGGRCNVTHFCFEARELVKNYPRGEKELLGPFMRFNPAHTFEWFELRGVEIKNEDDGRCFPNTDNSQTIIDCFLSEAHRTGVAVHTGFAMDWLKQTAGRGWEIGFNHGKIVEAEALIIASGSSQKVWNALQQLGHTVVKPVPSLFTFNIKDERLKDLQGLSVPVATVKVKEHPIKPQQGPLLITHWGLSGPAILKLSAWGARELYASNHRFAIEVNWTGNKNIQQVKNELTYQKISAPRRSISLNPMFHLPKRLWERMISTTIKNPEKNFADLSNKEIELIAVALVTATFQVTGKSTFKEEFVTAGGISLSEVDFKTMKSRKVNNLYFAGEVLDIDAITGGFNFQAAWTTGFIAAALQ